MRPQIVGAALQKISQDGDISRALFSVLETQNIIEGEAAITLIPKNAPILRELVAAVQPQKSAPVKYQGFEFENAAPPKKPGQAL